MVTFSKVAPVNIVNVDAITLVGGTYTVPSGRFAELLSRNTAGELVKSILSSGETVTSADGFVGAKSIEYNNPS